MNKKQGVILVADDEKFFRLPLAEAMKFFGYRVVQAQNGEEFTQKAEKLIVSNKPFLFLVDNQMPERDGDIESQWCGFEHVIQLCKDHPDKPIGQRVLFLSRWGMEDLPENHKSEATIYGLLDEDHWHNVYTPFVCLKAYADKLFQ